MNNVIFINDYPRGIKETVRVVRVTEVYNNITGEVIVESTTNITERYISLNKYKDEKKNLVED